MAFIDLVLNLAGLLLWLNWRSERLDAAYRVPVISLAHAVRRAGSSSFEKWKSLALLGVLLLVRAIFCWHFVERLPYTFKLNLIAIELPFSSNRFWPTLLYSLLSFGFTLAYFYLALLLFSLVNARTGEQEPTHRFVRIHLGWVDRLPFMAKALLPGLVGMAAWMASAHALAGNGIIPAPRSFAELWQRGALIGLGVYLHWHWVILAVLLLYMVNTYVYLGRQPIWAYIQSTGRNLLATLQALPMRAGAVDFAPLLAMAIVSAIVVVLESGWKPPAGWSQIPGVMTRGVLPWLYEHAPF